MTSTRDRGRTWQRGGWQVTDPELIEAFLEWERRKGLSKATITKYGATVRGLAKTGPLLERTRDDVEAFLTSRNITEAGRYHYLSHMAAFYGWAIDEELTVEDPTRRIPRPKLPQRLPRPLGEADLELALATAGRRMRAWLTLGGYAGLRCQEIARLRAEDLYLEAKPPVLIVSAPKGRRQRAVPMHPLVEEALRAHGIPDEGYIFTRWDTAEAVQPYTVGHEVAKHLRELGIRGTAHQLRHAFATRVYAKSRDLRVTQELLGHQSPSTTAVYTQLAPSAAAEAVFAI